MAATAANKSISDFVVSSAIQRTSAPPLSSTTDFASLSVSEVEQALVQRSFSGALLERYPKAIREAIEDYRGACRRAGQDFQEAQSRPDFFPKEFPYPQDGSTDEFQRAIKNAVLRMDDLGKRTSFRSDGDNQQAHFVRPSLLAKKRILYLYPFFRSFARRPFWGVIPYARHERIGLLVHKDLTGESGYHFDGRRDNAWLGDIIDVLCRSRGGNLGFAEGYFEEEISEAIWCNSQTAYEYDFELRRRAISPIDLERAIESSNLEVFLSGDHLNVKLLVFDLWHKARIEKCVSGSNSWCVEEFIHDVDVPVGVGFTLSFLPRLLARDYWKQISDEALEKVDPIWPALQRCGIEKLNKK